jgi:hypothetical protein
MRKVLIALCVAAAALTVSAVRVGASELISLSNPLVNTQPSSSDWLTSINSARASEKVGPMNLSEPMLTSLPLPEQVFIVTNLERVDRGLPAISYMTAQLNADAQQGADAASDPGFPSTLSGGSPVNQGGSIWAGVNSSLEADYYWMYDDGWSVPPSPTTNADCTTPLASGCWGHRDNILESFAACSAGPPTLSMGAAYSSTASSGGSIAAVMIATCGPTPTDITLTWNQILGGPLNSAPETIGMSTSPNGQGFWTGSDTGAVVSFGAAHNYGSMSGKALNSPVVGLAATPDGGGYWLVGSDGGMFSFGDATFHGSTGAIKLNRPIVGMASTPDGGGYWLVAADGGIFSFGDARFYGSMGATPLNQPIVGMAADPASGGYWMVAADGGVFSFDAPFFGSTGALHLDKPIVGIAATPDGGGYWMVASDGGIFAFGDASFEGSTSGQALSAPIVGMSSDDSSYGYWLVGSDGAIYPFGTAFDYSSATPGLLTGFRVLHATSLTGTHRTKRSPRMLHGRRHRRRR